MTVLDTLRYHESMVTKEPEQLPMGTELTKAQVAQMEEGFPVEGLEGYDYQPSQTQPASISSDPQEA